MIKAVVIEDEVDREKIVQSLINAGADVNAKYEYQHNVYVSVLTYEKSALVWAAEKGYEKIVQCLINAGADVNAKICDNSTVLLFAAGWGHQSCSELLVEAMLRADENNALSFLCCLKKGAYRGSYSHLKQIFKPHLCQMINEAKNTIRMEICKITNSEIKQHLLEKYFSEEKKN